MTYHAVKHFKRTFTNILLIVPIQITTTVINFDYLEKNK